MKVTEKKNITRTILFTLTMGAIATLLLIANFSLIFAIGYGAIYTGIIVIFLIMYMLMRSHAKYLKREMRFMDTFLVGFPVFAISTIICFLVVDYDFDGTETYSYYVNGYLMHVLEETGKQFIPVTLLFVLIFAPLYKQIKKLKLNTGNIRH